MPDFPNLAAMGLTDSTRISHYRLAEKESETTLKIYLNDEESLPHQESHSYTFQHNTDAHSVQLPKILSELDTLTLSGSSEDKQQLLIDELEKLEQVMSAKISELKDDLKRIA